MTLGCSGHPAPEGRDQVIRKEEDGESSDNDDPSELTQISESEAEDEWGYGHSWRSASL